MTDKALWVAGKGFRCKGDALNDPTYQGPMLRPDDLKRTVSRFYEKKRDLREQKKEESGMPVHPHHSLTDDVGDVHHMFVDKDMNIWNVMRISASTKPGREFIERIKSGDKKKRVGISYDTEFKQHKNAEGVDVYINRKIFGASLVDIPAHDDDDTYVSHWADSEAEVLKQVFANIYGPDVDSSANKPYYITKALKADVKHMFGAPETNSGDSMDVESDDKAASVDKKTPPPDEKQKEESTGEIIPPDSEIPLESGDLMETEENDALFDGTSNKSADSGKPSKSLASAVSKASTTATMSGPGTTTNTAKNATTSQEDNSKQNTSTSGPAGQQQQGAKKRTLEEMNKTSAPKQPLTSSAKAPIVTKKVPAKLPPAEEEDAMNIDDELVTNDNQDDAQANEQVGEQDEGEFEEGQVAAGDEEDMDMDDETSRGKNKSSGGYDINERDADLKMRSLKDSMQEVLRLKNLANASKEDKDKYFESLLKEKINELQEENMSTQSMLKSLLADTGLTPDQMEKVASAAENPATAGVVKTLLAAAHVKGQNTKLLEADYQRQSKRPRLDSDLLPSNGKSVVNTKSVFKGPSKSIFAGGSSKNGDDLMDLDFARTIFNNSQFGYSTSSSMNRVPQQQQQQQQRPQQSQPRLGGRAPKPAPTAEEIKRQEEESYQDALLKKFELFSPNRIVRTTPIKNNHPLFNIRDEEGQFAVDSMELPENVLDNVRPDSFTHQVLNNILFPDFNSLEQKRIVTYGDDKYNDAYYGSARELYRAPRRINGGVMTIGSDSIKETA